MYWGTFIPKDPPGQRRAGVALLLERPPAGHLIQLAPTPLNGGPPSVWRTLPLPKDVREGPPQRLELFLSFEEATKLGLRIPDPEVVKRGERGALYQLRHVRAGSPSAPREVAIETTEKRESEDRFVGPRGVQRVALGEDPLPAKYTYQPMFMHLYRAYARNRARAEAR